MAGCLLVAGGVGCLALLPGASAWWTVAPQVLAGAGMGMALPALSGELMPERTRHDVSRLLSIRHAGIAIALAALAPLISANLTTTVDEAREQGPRRCSTRPCPRRTRSRSRPSSSAASTPTIPAASSSPLSTTRARASTAMRRQSSTAWASDSTTWSTERSARRSARPSSSPRASRWSRRSSCSGVRWPRPAPSGGRQLPRPPRRARGRGLRGRLRRFRARDGRDRRSLRGPRPPDSGGITGEIQQISSPLDRAACDIGSGREELLLALFDDRLQEEFEEEHGVNPRSPAVLGPALLGL